MKRTSLLWAWILAASVFAPAWAQDAPPEEGAPLDEPPAAEEMAQAEAAEQAPGFPEEGQRDPFRPFFVREKKGVEAVGPDIQRLELVATIIDMQPPRALLQDASGMGYIVTPGMQFGQRGEVVAAVERGRVVFQETSVDYYGQESVTERVIEIQETTNPRLVGQRGRQGRRGRRR